MVRTWTGHLTIHVRGRDHYCVIFGAILSAFALLMRHACECHVGSVQHPL